MKSSLGQFGIKTLGEAHTTFLKLIHDGSARKDIGLNQFGEIAMLIDVAAEEAIIEHLRAYSSKQGQGIRVVSEEHGEFTIGDSPQMTAFLDGLVGSSAFRDSKGAARCGTMFALYKGADPAFQDYLLGGIVDHIQGKTVVATKGDGTQLVANSKVSVAKVSGTKVLNNDTRIDIDEGVKNYVTFPTHDRGYFYDPIKGAFKTRYVGSSAVYFFDLAVGETDLVLEYGRKNNLEHMAAYPLIIESGGVMEFVAGNDLGPVHYGDYCAMDNGYPAIIAAATHQLAEAVRDYN